MYLSPLLSLILSLCISVSIFFLPYSECRPHDMSFSSSSSSLSPLRLNPSSSVLFLSLDERYTTRDLFLLFSQLTNFTILTPAADTDMVPHHKVPVNLTALDEFVFSHLNISQSLLISSEDYLYGGLIASRSSNQSTAEVQKRLDRILASLSPSQSLYLSSVIMRIPHYSSDFEEPWYWGVYGEQLYEFSYYTDKFNVLGNPADHQSALYWESLVPPHIVDEFIWRRQRNFNVTVDLLQYMRDHPGVVTRLAITLDDNALYGFNIAESRVLKKMVISYNLSDSVLIYPGADEVQLSLLAKMTTDVFTQMNMEIQTYGNTIAAPSFQLVFHNSSQAALNLVPNYEGQPMILTLLEQIDSAGGLVVTCNSTAEDNSFVICDSTDILLLVNNFDSAPQHEAPNQKYDEQYLFAERFSNWEAVIPEWRMAQKGRERPLVVGFADNRFSNGGDMELAQYLFSLHNNPQVELGLGEFAYAGWNTDGNKLGTVISNCILYFWAMFSESESVVMETESSTTQWNSLLQVLRLLEDVYYQSYHRQTLGNYANEVDADHPSSPSFSNVNPLGENSNNLTPSLNFYEEFIWKLEVNDYLNITDTFGMTDNMKWAVDGAYFPWNRTFEIGFTYGLKKQ